MWVLCCTSNPRNRTATKSGMNELNVVGKPAAVQNLDGRCILLDLPELKLAGKESEFSANQHWNRTSGSDCEPDSTAITNLIRQAWFCSLNFVFDSLTGGLIVQSMCVSMMHRPHTCVSKLNYVFNRPTVVHYQECWFLPQGQQLD